MPVVYCELPNSDGGPSIWITLEVGFSIWITLEVGPSIWITLEVGPSIWITLDADLPGWITILRVQSLLLELFLSLSHLNYCHVGNRVWIILRSVLFKLPTYALETGYLIYSWDQSSYPEAGPPVELRWCRSILRPVLLIELIRGGPPIYITIKIIWGPAFLF